MARAYYNEIEPYTAQWLRNLIAEGLIAPGDVDERSIADVQPSDLEGYAQCHFFAGIGGWSYALRLAGWPDARPVWTGSCPCQPFSVAGARKGFNDERHLWPEFRRLISERLPPVVYGEQVAGAAEWLRLVRGDLEALDYAVGAEPVEAASAGADHLRDRFWFVADADFARSQGWNALPERADQRAFGSDGLAHADELRASAERSERGGEFGRAGRDQEACTVGDRPSESEREPHHEGHAQPASREARSILGGPGDHIEWVIGADGKARRVKPGIRLLAHGVPARVGKLRAFGNAIDPRPAAAFIASTPAFYRTDRKASAA